MRDVGALMLALAVVLGAAAVTLDRLLVRVALAANLVSSVPHFVFHATHLQHFSTGDAVGETIILSVTVLLPAALLLVSLTTGADRRPGTATLPTPQRRRAREHPDRGTAASWTRSDARAGGGCTQTFIWWRPAAYR